jgi:hypothetical protein
MGPSASQPLSSTARADIGELRVTRGLVHRVVIAASSMAGRSVIEDPQGLREFGEFTDRTVAAALETTPFGRCAAAIVAEGTPEGPERMSMAGRYIRAERGDAN